MSIEAHMSEQFHTSGEYDLQAVPKGDKVAVALTVRKPDGEAVTVSFEVSRQESRQMAHLLSTAAGDAFARAFFGADAEAA